MEIEKYKLQRKNKYKKIIIGTSIVLLIAAGVFVPKLSAYENISSRATKKYDDTNFSIYDDNDFFASKKSYYEFQDNYELNTVIDQIKQVRFQSNDDYYINYDILNLPTKEINNLKQNTNILYDNNNYNNIYNWYANGKIDSNKLYKKIVGNSGNVSDHEKEIINCFSCNIQLCIDYIKNKVPDYDFGIALKNIDCLCIGDFDDKNYMGWYGYDINELLSDYNYTKDNGIFRYNIIHESFHLLENKMGYYDNNYYMSGFNIEQKNTEVSPLFLDFMCERFTDEFAVDLCPEINVGYVNEKNRIDNICCSTNKNSSYYKTAFLKANQNALIYAFEPEFQDFNYVYSTLDGLDISCGYGNVPYGCDEDSFRTNIYFYSNVNLLKNGYVRIIKDLDNGIIGYDEANDKIIKLKKQILNNHHFTYKINVAAENSLNECVNQLDDIFYQYHYSKVK